MSAEEDVLSGDLTTGNFTIQAALPMGKNITVSGYIYSKNTVDDINAQVDKFHDVIDRQRCRAEIPELEAKMDQRHVQLGQLRDALVHLEGKQKSEKKLSSAEKQSLANLGVNITRLMEDIEKGKVAIADAKIKAGV